MASDICYVCGTRNMRGSVCLTCCPDGDPRLKPANTRPAPAATDTGLETGLWTMTDVNGKPTNVTTSVNDAKVWLELGYILTEYVTRSQAEELFAAAHDEKMFHVNDAVKAWNEVSRLETRVETLEADNAAQAARIKELEASRNEMDNIAYAAGFYQAECNLPEHKNAQEALKEYRGLKAIEAKLAAGTVTFHLEWIAGARPPVHPEPMNGRQSFESFDKAIAFMHRQAADAQFVSLIERTTIKTDNDRSSEARAELGGKPEGRKSEN